MIDEFQEGEKVLEVEIRQGQENQTNQANQERRGKVKEITFQNHQFAFFQTWEIGIGGDFWTTGHLLLQYIENYASFFRSYLKGKRVLELGAGTGLVSLPLLLFSPKEIMITDIQIAVETLIIPNIIRNCKTFMKERQHIMKRQKKLSKDEGEGVEERRKENYENNTDIDYQGALKPVQGHTAENRITIAGATFDWTKDTLITLYNDQKKSDYNIGLFSNPTNKYIENDDSEMYECTTKIFEKGRISDSLSPFALSFPSIDNDELQGKKQALNLIDYDIEREQVTLSKEVKGGLELQNYQDEQIVLEDLSQDDPKQFDVVFGTDVVYSPKLYLPFIRTLKLTTSRDTLIIVGVTRTDTKSEFFHLLHQHGFDYIRLQTNNIKLNGNNDINEENNNHENPSDNTANENFALFSIKRL